MSALRRVFADTVAAMMDEHGITPEGCGMAEVRRTAALCAGEYARTVADLAQWVRNGTDEAAKAREVVRASLRTKSMWDKRNWRQ